MNKSHPHLREKLPFKSDDDVNMNSITWKDSPDALFSERLGMWNSTAEQCCVQSVRYIYLRSKGSVTFLHKYTQCC
jgi:hypothetical protein